MRAYIHRKGFMSGSCIVGGLGCPPSMTYHLNPFPEWKAFCGAGAGCDGVQNLLVVEHYIREPNHLGRNAQLFEAFIFLWIPTQSVVIPLLQRQGVTWTTLPISIGHHICTKQISIQFNCICIALNHTYSLSGLSRRYIFITP